MQHETVEQAARKPGAKWSKYWKYSSSVKLEGEIFSEWSKKYLELGRWLGLSTIYVSIYLFIHSSEINFNKQLKGWCGRYKAWQKSDQTVTFVAPGHFHISSHARFAEGHTAWQQRSVRKPNEHRLCMLLNASAWLLAWQLKRFQTSQICVVIDCC